MAGVGEILMVRQTIGACRVPDTTEKRVSSGRSVEAEGNRSEHRMRNTRKVREKRSSDEDSPHSIPVHPVLPLAYPGSDLLTRTRDVPGMGLRSRAAPDADTVPGAARRPRAGVRQRERTTYQLLLRMGLVQP